MNLLFNNIFIFLNNFSLFVAISLKIRAWESLQTVLTACRNTEFNKEFLFFSALQKQIALCHFFPFIFFCGISLAKAPQLPYLLTAASEKVDPINDEIDEQIQALKLNCNCRYTFNGVGRARGRKEIVFTYLRSAIPRVIVYQKSYLN